MSDGAVVDVVDSGPPARVVLDVVDVADRGVVVVVVGRPVMVVVGRGTVVAGWGGAVVASTGAGA
jgi:hypothetical protein